MFHLKRHGTGRTIAWLATGATLVAAGTFLGAAAGRRRERVAPARPRPEDDEDLADRPVARAALAEAVQAARRVDRMAASVASLEARVTAIETSTSARVEAVWQRVLRLEERLEQLKAERAGQPGVEQAAAEAERRLAPRLEALEGRVEQSQAALRQLEAHAAQTEINLQKMLAAVEKLADQVTRALPPPGPPRVEPQRETAAAAEAPAEGERRPASFGWRSVALLGAISAGLLASYATWPGGSPAATLPSPTAAAQPAAQLVDTAWSSLTALAAREPQNKVWKFELARLCEMRGDADQAKRWYRALLEQDPQEWRAQEALAELLTRRAP